MTPKEVLVGGKAIIEEYGWVQGRFGDTTRGFCAYGAMDYAWVTREGPKVGKPELYNAVRLFRETAGAPSVDRWNDEICRTKEEVLAMFDKAIARAEEAECSAQKKD